MIAKFQEEVVKLSKQVASGHFLCSVFLMSEPFESYDGWQYDFCDPATKELTSFVVFNGTVASTSIGGQAAQKNIVHEPLDLAKVIFSFDKMITELLIAVGGATVSKFIFVLHAKNSVPIWNVSALTSDFHLVHLELSGVDGEVLASSKESVLHFKG